MMSGFICVVFVLAIEGGSDDDGGFPRAAFRLPSGVDEGVMLETVDEEVMSEVVRGEERRRLVGLPNGGDGTSDSGEVGGEGGGEGEGESRGGDCCSSGVAMAAAGGVGDLMFEDGSEVQ